MSGDVLMPRLVIHREKLMLLSEKKNGGNDKSSVVYESRDGGYDVSAHALHALPLLFTIVRRMW
jgi:hypothetical protein